jgi:hypothetical protein
MEINIIIIHKTIAIKSLQVQIEKIVNLVNFLCKKVGKIVVKIV